MAKPKPYDPVESVRVAAPPSVMVEPPVDASAPQEQHAAPVPPPPPADRQLPKITTPRFRVTKTQHVWVNGAGTKVHEGDVIGVHAYGEETFKALVNQGVKMEPYTED